MKANLRSKLAILHPNQIKIGWGLTKYALLANLRNKANLAFGLMFPLAFVAIFGVIGSSSPHIRIGVPDNLDKSSPIYQTVKSIGAEKDSPLTLEEGSQADLEKKLSQSNLDSILENGVATTELTLVTSNGNPQGAAASSSFFNGILSQLNLKAAQVTTPTFSLQGKELSGKKYEYIDFALPGQVGFSLIALSTFGVAFSFITLRKTLVLKRLFATTITPLAFVISQCVSRAIQAAVQAAIIILAGVYFFHFNLIHGWQTVVAMVALSALGALLFLGFGMLLSNIARDEQSAPILLNLFNLPQFLLSGVFFPIDGMPGFLQNIGNNLPLSFFTNGLRKISVEGAGWADMTPYILGMVVWGVIAYVLAAKTFKAE